METLIRRQRMMLENIPMEYVRGLEREINWDLRLIALRGARGVGKTTLLLQHIRKTFGTADATVLYVSMDAPYFSRHALLDFAEDFYLHGGRYLFIDEIHKYAGWSREIKSIYDFFPSLHVVFTGSSLLHILNAEADLSRRCISYEMQGFSFREYLQLRHDHTFPAVKLEELLEHPSDLCQAVCTRIRPLSFFSEYLRSGYYPFTLEDDGVYALRLENTVNMILELELPQVAGVDVGNIRKLRTLLTILSSSVPFSADMTKLSAAIGVSRTTLLGYLSTLERARLINLLYSAQRSVKKMQKPDKIYMENPNLLHTLSIDGVNAGTEREVFVVNQLRYAHTVEYAAGAADFLVDGKYTIEVGGAAKDGKQISGIPAAFIAADNLEYPLGNKIPLWAFGFLY